jgi:hypothetical protein
MEGLNNSVRLQNKKLVKMVAARTGTGCRLVAQSNISIGPCNFHTANQEIEEALADNEWRRRQPVHDGVQN